MKFFKTEQLECDVDAISAMDINIFGEIIGDFKHLITIKMSSARCNPSITEKYYETLLKMEKEKLPTS